MCSVEPGTEARRKRGLQIDIEEGVQRRYQTKPGEFVYTWPNLRMEGHRPVGPKEQPLLDKNFLTSSRAADSCRAAGMVTPLY